MIKIGIRCNCKLIMLMTLMLLVMAGYSTVVYAASGANQNTQLQDERGIFDPFTLNTFIVVRESNVNVTLASEDGRPPIRIPTRPALRSYFRPSLVPLATSIR